MTRLSLHSGTLETEPQGARAVLALGRTPTAPRWILSGAILVLAVAGAFLSGQLLKQHDNIWGDARTPQGWWAGLCEATAPLGLDCRGAVKGRWSEVRLPAPTWSGGYRPTLGTVRVPVAFIGLAYFGCLASWFLMVGANPQPGRAWRGVPLVLTAMGAAASCCFLFLMAAGHAPRCLVCVSVHGVSLLLTTVVWAWGVTSGRHGSAAFGSEALFEPEHEAQPQSRRQARRELAEVGGRSSDRIGVAGAGRHGGRPLRFDAVAHSHVASGNWFQAIRALVVALVLVAGLWMYRSQHLAFKEQWAKLMPYKALVTTLRSDKAFLLREHLAEPEQQVVPPTAALPASDRPQLVIFSDYDCPNCACGVDQIVRNARQAFGERLDVVVRHYPLCVTCNPHVTSTTRAGACTAAYAAEAARLQGGDEAFRAMHERLLMRRQGRDRESLARLAERVGLERERFLADLDGEVVRQVVADHVALAHAWGVRGTPTLFFDGRRVNRQFEGPAYWQALAENWQQRDDPPTVLTELRPEPQPKEFGAANERR